jgi:hypothetical protein
VTTRVTKTAPTRLSPFDGDTGPWGNYLILCFLQGLFNHFPKELFRWEPDDEDSSIVITEESPVERNAVAKRPHLVVMRGAYEWANLALDKMRNMNTMTGERVHTDLVPGHTTVHCIAETGREASWIADLVWRGTNHHKRLLQKVGGFHHIGQNGSVGPETSPGMIVRGSSEVEAVMVDVLLPWYMQSTWGERPIVPPQKTTLELVFAEPRARDVEKPGFDALNDATLLAHYGVANSEDVEAEFGMRGR